MSFDNFKTYGDSPQTAFETLSTQLFERYLRRTYRDKLVKFRVVNGAGGDGGIEAYGELDNGDLIAVQAKWFRNTIETVQVNQMKKSFETALILRDNIVEYIFCVPRPLNSLKFGRGAKGEGKKPVLNTEEKEIDKYTDEIESAYPSTKLTWWFEQELEFQIQEEDNEGIHKFWFDRELISIVHLIQQFDLQKKAWIEHRYIPELHGQGVIQREIQEVLFSQAFRKELLEQFNLSMRILQNASKLIQHFTETLADDNDLKAKLDTLQVDINNHLAQLILVSKRISEGLHVLRSIKLVTPAISKELLNEIGSIKPIDRQLGIQERLINSLDHLRDIDFTQAISDIQERANQIGRLFLGNSGTGKTHALTNTVDLRLNRERLPAIIIRAKGMPCSDWTQILKKTLDLDGWDRRQILSALETLAIRGDHREAQKLSVGEEVKRELAKVVICIDGLEEDTLHWQDWYERMRESIELMNQFPRVRFIYTARTYFFNKKDVPKDDGFKVVEIPNEGDVPVSSVIDDYFAPAHFNIEVNPRSLIRGIDSLYALRLFCDLYRGQVLTSGSDIITAERDLLNEKVNRIEHDFRKIKDAGLTRKPIREAIGTLSEIFYTDAEIGHEQLADKLQTDSLSYFAKEDIDKLIDYLANNGFLIRSELPVGKGILMKTKVVYNLTYQSIMELIMSEKYAEAIANGDLTKLPAHLVVSTADYYEDYEESNFVHERIVQLIVNKLFHENDKLIGRDGFLNDDLDDVTIQRLQLNALIAAPANIGKTLKPNINELYFRDYKSRSFVFRNLIYPSAASASNYFGAEYLHEILMNQPSAFEREKLWMGWDRYDIHELNEKDSINFYRYDLRNAIDPYDEEPLHLPEFSLHNEYPLIYGWALTTLNQTFRKRLRNALTEWSIRHPVEYKLLLQKLFHCNDPQIQEDLAAIAWGLASKLKDGEPLRELAQWALENVFSDQEKYSNVIVRMGFRAIVERAFLAGTIDKQGVEKARPKPLQKLSFIPLDQDSLKHGGEEIYPIVHDLAWYVIKKTFDDFFDYESVNAGEEPEDARLIFLMAYLDTLGLAHLSVFDWSISAAIAYIKSLGFVRQQGNHYTSATHGSKSKEFTLEEKYTWLAVHQLQGYLSDHLPLKNSEQFILDYMQIVSIDNPAESIGIMPHAERPDIESNWIIKEPFAPEMQGNGAADDQIRIAVESVPVINFDKWLEFKDTEFRTTGSDDEWLALYNYTTVHDSKDYIYSSLDVRGIIIDKGQVPVLLDIVTNHPDRSHFVEGIDRMVGSPDTDTYSNPSDIVWMSWIGETESGESYYVPADGQEKVMQYTITSVTKNNTDGEEEIYIPSKLVRTLMGISEMNQHLFLDDSGKVKAFNHILANPNYDKQEMTLVRKEEFLNHLDKCNLELVWLADLYRTKNALNEHIKSDIHPMKTRKYLIWYDQGKLVAANFWDARFSNQRDGNLAADDLIGDQHSIVENT